MALLIVLTVLALDALVRLAVHVRAGSPAWTESPGTPLSAL
jgi:hypothetical protein